MTYIQGAPDELFQPILPGWMFGNIISVSKRNSSSPNSERRIVEQYSYGRQLGQIIDALCDLITRQPPQTKAMSDLLTLKKEIDAIKDIERLRSLLADPEQPDKKKQYEGLLDQLHQMLSKPE